MTIPSFDEQGEAGDAGASCLNCLGIGIDLVVIDRIGKLMRQRPSAAARLFGSRELALAEALPPSRRDEFFAGRFAVKEAFCKAIGAEHGVDLREIECLSTEAGAPILALGGTAAAAVGRAVPRVSLSHDGGFVIAIVQL